MKFRFRNYVRQGWEVVEVPRTNLYNWNIDNTEAKIGNRKHYQDICNWCAKNFKDGNWVSTIHNSDAAGKNVGIKRFAFRNAKHATLFRMQWL